MVGAHGATACSASCRFGSTVSVHLRRHADLNRSQYQQCAWPSTETSRAHLHTPPPIQRSNHSASSQYCHNDLEGAIGVDRRQCYTVSWLQPAVHRQHGRPCCDSSRERTSGLSSTITVGEWSVRRAVCKCREILHYMRHSSPQQCRIQGLHRGRGIDVLPFAIKCIVWSVLLPKHAKGEGANAEGLLHDEP